VLDLAHLRDQVRKVDELGVRVAAGADYVHTFGRAASAATTFSG